MTLLQDGTTGVENGYDYDAAIRNRLQPIDDIGTSQSNYVAEAAQRRLVAKQASDNAALNSAAGADQSGNIANSANGGSSGAKGDNFEAFKSAISGQESGGNYSSRNASSGAMGKYQIMPSNLGGTGSGWDYDALGYDINASQFMASPQLQEKIATNKLQNYYSKYGAAGAAVAWYAGEGMVGKAGNSSQGSYPTINAYSQSILRRMGL